MSHSFVMSLVRHDVQILLLARLKVYSQTTGSFFLVLSLFTQVETFLPLTHIAAQTQQPNFHLNCHERLEVYLS